MTTVEERRFLLSAYKNALANGSAAQLIHDLGLPAATYDHAHWIDDPLGNWSYHPEGYLCEKCGLLIFRRIRKKIKREHREELSLCGGPSWGAVTPP